jgi:hypothetical protein
VETADIGVSANHLVTPPTRAAESAVSRAVKDSAGWVMASDSKTAESTTSTYTASSGSGVRKGGLDFRRRMPSPAFAFETSLSTFVRLRPHGFAPSWFQNWFQPHRSRPAAWGTM